MRKIQKIRKEIINEIKRLGFDSFYNENHSWVDEEGYYHYYANEFNEKLIKAYLETFGKAYLISLDGEITETSEMPKYPGRYRIIVSKVDNKLKKLLANYKERKTDINIIDILFIYATETLNGDILHWV